LNNKWGLGIGDWGLGIGDWGLGPIPNPQSPIKIKLNFRNCFLFENFIILSNYYFNDFKKMDIIDDRQIVEITGT